MNFNEIKKTDKENIMPTYGRFDVALVKGKNATATDPDGKEYIDFGSGIGVNSLGYCNDGWVNAVKTQLDTLQHTSNLYYSEPGTLLAKKLCELSQMDKVFLCNSGAEANECAIKVARKYSFDKYGKGRAKIVSLINSFHGRTLTTLTATGQEVFHNYFFPFTDGFDYVPAGDLETLKKSASDGACAVIMEMVQGEGGVRPLDKDYVTKAADFCREHDILLIIDEVQTGISRTGTFFSYMQFGINPDLVTAAKGLGGGLPVGACLCDKKLAEVMGPSTHGSTFGGNPVVAAGCNYVLSEVGTAEFMQSVSEKGNYIAERLKKLNNVADVRGMGMMIGIELKAGDAKTVVNKCLENGLLVLTAKTVVRLLPPLNISRAELEKGTDILCDVINSL